ncbi:hypothetical protein BO71DRAFT_337702, partial [Aspergillus ellipticus CBS 707.79]
SSKKDIQQKTYNRRDSLVVTHPTTNLPACGLSTAERTGSPVLHTLWSYVIVPSKEGVIWNKRFLSRIRATGRLAGGLARYLPWISACGLDRSNISQKWIFRTSFCPKPRKLGPSHS